MRPWLRRLLRGYSLVVFALLLLPLLIVVPISFSSARYLQFPPPGWSLQWYKRYLYDPAWIEATMVSLRVACGSTLLALILGTALAYSVVRGRYRGRVVVERLGSGPLIVPHIVIAIAIYSLFARMHLTGTETGLILAHTVLAIPFVLAVMSASLRTVDPVLEQAAMSLGVSRIGAIVRVTLPLIRPGIVSAGILAFLSSFDEVVVAIFLSGTTKTLPKQMFDNIMNEIDPTIAAISVLQIALVVVALALVARFGAKAVPR
ncbi:putative spermidine/putrescine transport system permease protein [Stella humosa]|uniref:Putative spermidine/putrescine transport system permease protein n=1 Tax=Stella humosa TaxID=94 RepID=A0A3N1M3C6_9PROT|nr:ABC transporter permease [Stella humosa]ROQ00252.1 putative spermidine/putrescine transport system permease protein [Stella humosa]BBK30511.1 polyamine ABC transporter permease [Stella humosa]